MAGAIDILWTFWSQERRLEKRFTPKKVQNLLTKEPQLRTHPVNITESHHLGLPSHHQCPGCENDNTAPTAKVQCLQKLPQKKKANTKSRLCYEKIHHTKMISQNQWPRKLTHVHLDAESMFFSMLDFVGPIPASMRRPMASNRLLIWRMSAIFSRRRALKP